MAVEAMRQGAIDFLRKPIDQEILLNRIRQAFEHAQTAQCSHNRKADILSKYRLLTERETQVFQQVAEGESNKSIAVKLDISERTVEVHRANVMKKMEAKTMAQLVRMQVLLE